MFLRIVSVWLLALGMPVAGWAMDNTSPIHIESDSLDIDDSRGISTYRGNVVFRQGGSQLWADEIVIYIKNRQRLEKVEALGQPARFKLVPDDKRQEVTTGEAARIEYRDEAGIMLLRGQANLLQAGNVFSGDVIEYDTLKRVVRAGKVVDARSEGRVKVTILPRQADEQGAAP